VVVVRAVVVDNIVIIAGAVEEHTVCVVVLNHIVVNFIPPGGIKVQSIPVSFDCIVTDVGVTIRLIQPDTVTGVLLNDVIVDKMTIGVVEIHSMVSIGDDIISNNRSPSVDLDVATISS
jgi:hypothetical protein